jgi:hypothetical protein
MTAGENDLLFDFVRIVGIACEYQNHQTRVPQRLDDGFLKILAGAYIAHRNPAIVAARLQGTANCFRNLLVFRRVVDEDWRAHDVPWPVQINQVATEARQGK